MTNNNKLVLGSALAGAMFLGSVGGSIISSTVASAATTTTPVATSTATTAATSDTTTSAPAMPAHGSASHEDAETAVTGDDATKAQAAAVKSVGSGTAGAVTSDFTKSGFETTVTKSDGSTVEVHLDSSFSVMAARGPGNGSSN